MENKSDKYLDTNEQIIRLIKEWDKYGRLIVAYDFDNTIYDYHKEGIKFPIVIDQLKQLGMLGCYMICFTSCDESRYSEIRKHLNYNGIPCHGINVDSDIVPFKGRKIYYNVFYDDRSGLGQVVDVMRKVIDDRIDNLIEQVYKLDSLLNLTEVDIIYSLNGMCCVVTKDSFVTGEGWNVMTKVPTISRKGISYMKENYPDFDVSMFPVFEEILKLV